MLTVLSTRPLLARRAGVTPKWMPALAASNPAASDARVLLGGLAIGGGILVAMASGSSAITLAMSALAVLASVVNPALGLVTLAFMAPLKSPLVVPTPGLNALLVGGILLGSIYRLPIDRPKISVGPAVLLLLGFVLYVAVQQLPDMAAGYPGKEGHLVGALFIQLLSCTGVVVAAGMVLRGRRPYPYLATLLISASIASALAILNAGQGIWPPLANLLDQPGDVRAIGPFGNPNYFGQFLASGVALTTACLISATSQRIRWALIVTGVILLGGLALSLSRGGMVTVIAGVAALVLARNRSIGILAVVVGIGLLLVVYPAFVDFRLASQHGTASEAARMLLGESDESRLRGVLAGVPLFASSPIFGVGFGHYSFLTVPLAGTTYGIAAHNWYMNVLAELGLVGITLWLLLIGAVAWLLRSRLPNARAIGFSVGTTYVVGSMFLEPPNSFQTSALSLIVITAALVADWVGDRRDPVEATATRSRPTGGSLGLEAGA